MPPSPRAVPDQRPERSSSCLFSDQRPRLSAALIAAGKLEQVLSLKLDLLLARFSDRG
jgi:hypothetical protein